jgi:hypothetical protein
MLRQPSSRSGPVSLEARGRGQADLAMGVLQYGTAFMAIVVVALLAGLR